MVMLRRCMLGDLAGNRGRAVGIASILAAWNPGYVMQCYGFSRSEQNLPTMLVILGLFALFTLGSTELDDVTVIRRPDPATGSGPDRWTLELHGRTNALGKPFFSPVDGALLEPNVGFNISHCNGWETHCDWDLDNWTREIKTGDISVATTPDTFTPGNMTSSSGRLDYVHVNRLSGTITSPNFPNNYTENDSRMHVISTVQGYNITLQFTDFDLCNMSGGKCFDQVRVFDGPDSFSKQLGSFCGNSMPPVLRSSSNVMAVHLSLAASRHCKTSRGFSADFKTEMTDLVLTADEGNMTSPEDVLLESRICVSVTYLLEPGSSIEVLAQLRFGETIPFGKAVSKEVGNNWKIQRFVTDLGEKNFLKPFRVVLIARRTGTSRVFVERISGCNPDTAEETYISETTSPMTFEKFEHQDVRLAIVSEAKAGNYSMECFNGGRFDSHYKQCVCPAGFTGTTCEVACGPNRYGDDCGGFCSMTEEECVGIIMLRRGHEADCGPGIKHDRRGVHCSERCATWGVEYSNNCNLRCGNCSTKSCDIYTGFCDEEGCEDGYIAPNCQQKYKHFISMPTFVSNDFTSITCEVNMTSANMAGVGEPVYYSIYHALNSTDDWVAHDPRPIPKDADLIRSRLTGLTPGMLYRIQAVLIHADLGSYTEEVSHLMWTDCVVPEYVSFNISGKERPHTTFDIKWNIPDVTNTWCREKHVEVHVKALGIPWSLYSLGNTGSTVTIKSLLSATQFYIKLRLVTIRGAVAQFSKPKEFLTSTTKPGLLRNLRAANVTANTISLVWDDEPGASNRRYVVSRACQQIAQCEASCEDWSEPIEVSQPFAEFSGLIPFSRYKFSVYANGSEYGGDSIFTYIVTDVSMPQIAPDLTIPGVTNLTTSSFDAYWSRPEDDCTYLNGFMLGYRYNLTAYVTGITVELGNTTEPRVSFTNLEADTRYALSVCVLSTGGWNESYSIIMDVITKD